MFAVLLELLTSTAAFQLYVYSVLETSACAAISFRVSDRARSDSHFSDSVHCR